MLAERVGLTKGTVSAVLNCTPHSISIPQRTKDRVFAMARELNYQPNPIARALRRSLVGPVNRDDLGIAAGALMFKEAEHLMRAILAIRQAGLSVPGDVSVVALEQFLEFDDSKQRTPTAHSNGAPREWGTFAEDTTC
ncbi:MAG: LacI family DNA-binding transcriptional regulator [Candidatus Sulfotelmatobacter sp.]